MKIFTSVSSLKFPKKKKIFSFGLVKKIAYGFRGKNINNKNSTAKNSEKIKKRVPRK